METAPDLLTIGEAAKALGVGTKTVRRWADAGHLRFVRTPGHQRRFDRAEVEALLALPPHEPDEATA